MKKVVIVYDHLAIRHPSQVQFLAVASDCNPSDFITKDGYGVVSININKNSLTWRMEYCHELAHVLTVSKAETVNPWWADIKEWKQQFKWEVMAWRIAKSFCKEEYWKEGRAVRALKSYAKQACIKIDWTKFKIIELNEGTKL